MYHFGPKSVGNDKTSTREGEYKVFCHLSTCQSLLYTAIFRCENIPPEILSPKTMDSGPYPGTFEKTKNFIFHSRMQLHTLGTFNNHLECIYINRQAGISIFVYAQKNFLSEGPLGVQIFIYLSYGDYLSRGVKTGIYYPYACVITCIRVIKIPL